MAVTRPLKEGSVTTYQAKVAAGFPDILASEMDADLDTIYAAWNGGVAAANLSDGAVTTPKLADGAVTSVKIGPGQTVWTQAGSTGPASNVTVPISSGAPVLVLNTSLTVAAGRPVLLLGTVAVQVGHTSAAVTGVTIYVSYYVGGSPTGVDGTFLFTNTLVVQNPSGMTDMVTGPYVGLFTPGAGALPFKIFAASTNVADYTSFVPANTARLQGVQLS